MVLPTPKDLPEERAYTSIGVRIPIIYLPRAGIDLTRWCVVACDQYTSQPEYWEQVQRIVGNNPSTLHLTLPEIWLGMPGEAQRIAHIQATMQEYLQQGILQPSIGMMYVERTVGAKTRRGLLLCLDLEQYDYTKGAHSLIRATEGTIVDRLPPRIKIRQGAALEFPHILVLIDDPQRTVIEPLEQQKARLVQRYDFDLMLDSGHLSGYQIQDTGVEAQVVKALQTLAEPQSFQQKYGVGADQAVLLFAMGDGNHSLATAKAIWEQIKTQVGMHHPARYALVEIENVHDEGLSFEPIHRVLFNLQGELTTALNDYFGLSARLQPCASPTQMAAQLEQPPAGIQAIGVISAGQHHVLQVDHPKPNLAVGTLQGFLDQLLERGMASKIDYIHGSDVVEHLSAGPGNYGFLLPVMNKSDLFKTVILDGALPRKTFSMGEAHEKRFYLEGRRIS